MLREISVVGFKSIPRLDIDLGRVSVFLGASGAGKTNILEAIAFCCAAGNGALRRDELEARGIRVGHDAVCLAGFGAARPRIDVAITQERAPRWNDELTLERGAWHSRRDLERERALSELGLHGRSLSALRAAGESIPEGSKSLEDLIVDNRIGIPPPPDFPVFTVEASSLRESARSRTRWPLGTRGEGLFAHLADLAKTPDAIGVCAKILDRLDGANVWGLRQPLSDLGRADAPTCDVAALFSPERLSDGGLKALFCAALLAGHAGLSCIAIDNLDAGVPYAFAREYLRLVRAGRFEQVIASTSDPRVIDGLDIRFDEERLFVVERDQEGKTSVRRVLVPSPQPSEPIKLSEALARGELGGLPTGLA